MFYSKQGINLDFFMLINYNATNLNSLIIVLFYYSFLFILEETSPLFEEFLTLIGAKIQLKGFNGFKGGLDTCCMMNFCILLI